MKLKQDWNADLYNQKHGFVHQYGAQLIDILAPKPGERILDLGCGSGQLTNRISEAGSVAIGIDSSVSMIDSAKQLFPRLDFQVMDAALFSFDESFDAIFSNAALHWVKDQKGATKSIYENLKMGGRLVVEFGGKNNVAQIIRAIRSVLIARGYLENARLERWYFPSISEYTALLEEYGFEVSLAQLYDRPTLLESKNKGIEDWIEMFGAHFFLGIDAKEKATILSEVQNNVRSKCFKDGQWYADYRRIRVVAMKK